MNPFDVTENAMGFKAVRVHYSASPAKDPATEEGAKWYARARQMYPDENMWNQEFELNWWIAKGVRVYPQFSETVHGLATEFRDRKVVYRAWDFGWHAPCCLLAQIDSKDRLVVHREIVGHEETTKQFAEKVLAKCAEWWPHHTAGFQDFCDPAGQQRKSTAEASEVRDVEVLQALGVWPSWQHGWTRKHGRALVHQLLQVRSDETPSMYVNPSGCPVLLQGFLGKYVYPGKAGGKAHDEPDENNHPWADAHACLRYLATGLYSALGLRHQTIPDAEPRWDREKMMGDGTKVSAWNRARAGR